jgi:hypothetical protein
VYRDLDGPGELTVRVPQPGNTGSNARIGLAIRDTLNPDSAMGFIGINSSGSFFWSRRASAGAKAGQSTSASGTAPNIWLRIRRLADGTVEGWRSTNGSSWTRVSTVNINSPQVRIGMAVSSGSNSVLNLSTFQVVEPSASALPETVEAGGEA